MNSEFKIRDVGFLNEIPNGNVAKTVSTITLIWAGFEYSTVSLLSINE